MRNKYLKFMFINITFFHMYYTLALCVVNERHLKKFVTKLSFSTTLSYNASTKLTHSISCSNCGIGVQIMT